MDSIQKVNTFYGSVRLSSFINSMAVPETMNFFAHRTVYINNFSQNVTLQMRSGLKITIPTVHGNFRKANNPWNKNGEFIIRKEYRFLRETFNELNKLFANIGKDDDPTMQALRDSFYNQFNTDNPNMAPNIIHCTIDHYFTEPEINNFGGVFYHHETDILFVLETADSNAVHPFSKQGQEEELIQNTKLMQDIYGFAFSVEIIDSLNKFGDRYISICNSVYKIKSRADKNKRDGIYIVSNVPTNGSISSNKMEVNCHSFETAEKELGIYRTYEDAKVNGDPLTARKIELAELERDLQTCKHNAEMAKQEYAIAKSEADLILLERDKKIKELEYEREVHKREMEQLKAAQEHLMDMERMRLKDSYDNKSAHRKDSSETFKFLPLILTAIGAIIMWLKGTAKV